MEKSKKQIFKDMGMMLSFVGSATLIGVFFRFLDLQQTNVVVLYILSVVLTSRFTSGYLEGIIASILSMLAFNWFFAEPYYTLKVNDLTYIITFIIMTVTAILTSALTTKFKKAAREAKENETQTNALYQMTNNLTDAKNISEIASVILDAVSKALKCQAAIALFDENGIIEDSFLQQKEDGTQIHRELHNKKELEWKIKNLQSMYAIGDEFCDFPVYGKNMNLGILRIPKETAENLTEAQSHMLLSMIESAALAMERLKSFEEQAKISEEAEKERYRGNLLRAISHDIRTPLSGIMGSSEMLMQMLPKENEPYALALDIYNDADWLHSLVENILSLTRLQDGKLTLEKESEAVEEVIGAAIHTMKKRYANREFIVNMPNTFLMIPMNARLILQVLTNLLDNAVKHSPDDSEISICVTVLEKTQEIKISVLDNGVGLNPETLDHVFEMFYTTRAKCADEKRGIGLGLSICKTIVEAHGGTIYAKNRTDTKGAEFSFTLPMGE